MSKKSSATSPSSPAQNKKAQETCGWMISQNFELHKEKSGLKKLPEEEERDPDHRASSPRSIAQSSTATTASSPSPGSGAALISRDSIASLVKASSMRRTTPCSAAKPQLQPVTDAAFSQQLTAHLSIAVTSSGSSVGSATSPTSQRARACSVAASSLGFTAVFMA